MPEDNKIIKIGRSNEADISIDDDLTSRFHCFIRFDSKVNNWILYDGYISEDDNNSENKYLNIINSTNGTWIYLKDDFELTNDFLIKTNNGVIKAYIV